MSECVIKKVTLFEGKSDLIKLNYSVNNTNIYMKREDMIPYAFGGNKVRLIEYIIQCAIDSGCKKVVTYGSEYSNFLRVVAVTCAQYGLECHLICLENDSASRHRANQRLIDYTGAKIVYCKESEAHDFIDRYQDSLGEKNVDYYWIPGGGHIPEASFGYVDAADEIISQIDELNAGIDGVFIPCGTGTSQSGLVYGLCDCDFDVYGITVARSVDRCKQEIQSTLCKMEEIENRAHRDYRINVLEGKVAEYGKQNDAIREVITKVLVSDGIYLDPVYNAKSFLGMIQFLEQSKDIRNVIYVNTGGTPNLFI